MDAQYNAKTIRAIIGLGNPGAKYAKTRHNIGFRVVDELCSRLGASWKDGAKMEYASVHLVDGGPEVYLIKPMTFMNNSGLVMSFLQKKGIKPDQIIVVHDELEKKFGQVSVKLGGSAKGHNGLRSIIGAIGAEFWRLRLGIDRPVDREAVPDYVLSPFGLEEERALPQQVEKALQTLTSS